MEESFAINNMFKFLCRIQENIPLPTWALYAPLRIVLLDHNNSAGSQQGCTLSSILFPAMASQMLQRSFQSCTQACQVPSYGRQIPSKAQLDGGWKQAGQMG